MNPIGEDETGLDVAIIGAGFAGLAIAHHLKQNGIEAFAILERDQGVGGVWRANHYPGAACDVPSHLYSFSFFLNPDWSRKYSPQAEILAYLERASEALGLTAHIRTNTKVQSLRFEADTQRWRIEIEGGDTVMARHVVSAVGQLAEPAYPDIEGLDSFDGPVVHTAHWDETIDFTGKHVAVIGNAASAIQLIQKLAGASARLTIFQRTANWMINKPDRAFTGFEKWLFRRLPLWHQIYRRASFLIHEFRFMSFISGSLANRFTRWQMTRDLKRQIRDDTLRKTLTPDYQPGCKRILLSNDYYPTLAKDTVDLVNARASRIEGNQIVTPDGQAIDADAIILATGFHASEFLASLDVTGLDSKTLKDHWDGSPSAYNGVSVSGFPNLFMMYGPNTNLGHNSIVFMLERQSEYIAAKIGWALRNDLTLDVKPDAEAEFTAHMQAKLAQTVWAEDCGSWYRAKDGTVTNNWYGLCTSFAHILSQDDRENWQAL